MRINDYLNHTHTWNWSLKIDTITTNTKFISQMLIPLNLIKILLFQKILFENEKKSYLESFLLNNKNKKSNQNVSFNNNKPTLLPPSNFNLHSIISNIFVPSSNKYVSKKLQKYSQLATTTSSSFRQPRQLLPAIPLGAAALFALAGTILDILIFAAVAITLAIFIIIYVLIAVGYLIYALETVQKVLSKFLKTKLQIILIPTKYLLIPEFLLLFRANQSIALNICTNFSCCKTSSVVWKAIWSQTFKTIIANSTKIK